MARKVRIVQSGVRQLLTSMEMQRAVEHVAHDLAGRVRSAGSPVYPSLQVQVHSVRNGGARGDRAEASVVIPAPPASEVKYPDVAGRFGVLVGVARQFRR